MNENCSECVRIEWLPGGIAVVALEDRATHNSFSESFGKGVETAFERIAGNPEARAVVVHGVDSYFSLGGTQAQLLAIAEGRARYIDFHFFDSFRRCDLPVFTAFQGHAMGGGLAMGMHGDFLVLGEECVFSANFMAYGFTPGMGSTFTLPRKFGEALGWEMLFTGNNYRGVELRRRGVQSTVCPRAEVISTAIEQARVLASRPVQSLRELKRRWRETTASEFEEAVRRELQMHAVTLPLPEVRERIRSFNHL